MKQHDPVCTNPMELTDTQTCASCTWIERGRNAERANMPRLGVIHLVDDYDEHGNFIKRGIELEPHNAEYVKVTRQLIDRLREPPAAV